jgi:hypothetical protein
MNKKINQFRLRIIKSNKKKNKTLTLMIQFLTMLDRVEKVTKAVKENLRGK